MRRGRRMVAETFDFGRAVFSIEGENRQFISTLNESEAAATKTLGKMEGSLASTETQAINTTQAFTILGPAIGAVGGPAAAVAGRFVGLGAALAGVGKAALSLLTFPVMLIALGAAAGYAAYKFATFGNALKEANARLDEMKAKLKAQEEGIAASVKAIENQMKILRGAAPSSLIEQLPVRLAMQAKEALVRELALASAAEAVEEATIGRLNALDRELMIALGLRDQYDYITDQMQLRLALELKYVNLAKEEKRIAEEIAKAQAAATAQRIAGGQVRTFGEALTFQAQQGARAQQQGQTNILLAMAALWTKQPALRVPNAWESLFMNLPEAAQAAPAISATFGLAAVGAFAGGPRTPPPTIGAIQAQTMQQKVSRLVDQLQRLITPQGLKTLVQGMK